MNKGAMWTLSSVLAVAAIGAVAQTPSAPLVNQSFKDSDGGWMAIGQSGKVSISHEPEITLAGAGALKFEYTLAKGEFSALMLPAALDAWTKAKSFKFRIRSDSNAMFAVALQEQDGGRYTAMLQVPKGSWQPVELAASDFILSQDATDPKDPDGKLDLDRVTGIAITDIAAFLLSIDNPALVSMFDIKPGARTVYLDSFSIGTAPISSSTSSAGDTVQLDSLVHPQLSWLCLGGLNLTKSAGKPLDSVGIRADYRQAGGKIFFLSRALPSWVLTGSKVLTFDIASVEPTKLIVQFEQYDGGKYNMTLDLPGGSVAQHQKLLLSAFTRADDSKDADTKIHLASVKSIAILDVTGLLDPSVSKDNSLWIGKLKATTSTN